MLSRRMFLAGAAATGLPAAPAAERPNIVWIMLDDMGYGDPGCYGQKLIQTPNIDRLAAQSMRFTDCYAGGAVCAPSRSCIDDGLAHGPHFGAHKCRYVPLRPEDKTVAQMLKAAGYTNGLFGKWGLGDAGSAGVPTKKGFDEFYGYLHQIHAHDYYTEFLWHNETKDVLPGNAGGKRGQYSADVIAGKALDFVKKAQGKPVLPLFLTDASACKLRSTRHRTLHQVATGRRRKKSMLPW
jgi:Arylsulfatase A and related enzymes